MNTLNNHNQKGEAMTTTATTTATTTKKLVRKFHQDPGHGWLCVKIAELEALGIADKITGFSYMRKQSAYLEEDQDMTTYQNALKERGIELETVNGKMFNKDHPIKRFESYQYGSSAPLKKVA
jgi:hypothetical protein